MDAGQRPIDRWFAGYSADHRNRANQLIHVVCVPAIVWSIVAALWSIPAPGTWFRDGFWAGLAMFAATLFYYRQSRALGLGMLAMFALMALASNAILELSGRPALLAGAAGVFVLAWTGQFVGHSARFEGRRPSFLTDLRYLLVGPAWVLAKLYRRLGLRY